VILTKPLDLFYLVIIFISGPFSPAFSIFLQYQIRPKKQICLGRVY